MSSRDQRSDDKIPCPTCGNRFRMDETQAPPFCSQRCQLIDLGRWLDEDIGLPHCEDESPKTIDRNLVDGDGS
ncbi:DNA gyrase inhibitor YacG [Roseiconus nitratireducens]|uniref:DNA gyrase inhibitor YacG n=1 Tax=Roseiconus nitratireducens TaxID=2605748 RepID=A0A5M6D680_9BACT|nr:DNA gyrase inhibitor YacG [Roseiconus nitratireducens]KAA5540685.1 DNA gyrase inhibitor YacG [Roseiconus nitratireducens]